MADERLDCGAHELLDKISLLAGMQGNNLFGLLSWARTHISTEEKLH